MMEEARLNPAKVDATAIGFVLGPRLNAAGRLATADTSYRLLTAPDPLTARPLAEELGRLNLERQRLTQEMVAKAKAQIEASPSAGYLFLVSDESFNPGVVGLVAGRLTEEFYRPALVAHAGPDEAHGSARSIAEFNITSALDECRDLLRRYGGHAAAAGFTVANENISLLQARLEEIAARELGGQELAPSLSIDAVVGLSDIDWAMQGLLSQVEPCGYGNPQPVLATARAGGRFASSDRGAGWSTSEAVRPRSERHGPKHPSRGRCDRIPARRLGRSIASPDRSGLHRRSQRVQRREAPAIERQGYSSGSRAAIGRRRQENSDGCAVASGSPDQCGPARQRERIHPGMAPTSARTDPGPAADQAHRRADERRRCARDERGHPLGRAHGRRARLAGFRGQPRLRRPDRR